jgi:hypothetical protein
MQYKAPWGSHVKIMTIGGSIICIGAPVWFAITGGAPNDPVLCCMMRAPLFLWLACLLLTVRGYTITEDSILIHRLVWNTRLPLELISEIDFDPRTYYRALRCFGTGGLFGISGLYYTPRRGTFRAFLTDTKSTVLLKFSSRTILVSPPDPRRFVNALLRQTEQLSAL